jgi:hypothetical protein
LGAGAAQHGLDARLELVDVERLGDEVVRAKLEAEHPVAGLIARAADDDGGRRARLEIAAQHQPVGVGQHQVEDDQIGLHLVEEALGLSRGRRLPRAVTRTLQHLRERKRDGRIVLHEQDAGGLLSNNGHGAVPQGNEYASFPCAAPAPGHPARPAS